MSLNKNTRTCTHIKVNGTPCGSPSLRGEVFCYFHQRMIRGVATPPKSRLHPIAQIEDEEAIQTSLMEIINALVRNTIDFKRAQLILRALQIASRNAPRVHFRVHSNEMISEIPNYPATPAAPKRVTPPEPALAQAAALLRVPRPKPISIARPRPPIVAATPAPAPARPKPPAAAKPAPAARNAARRRSG